MCSWRASCVHAMNGFCLREYKYGCTCRLQCMSAVIKGFQFIIQRLNQQYSHTTVTKYGFKLHSDIFRWRKPTPRTKQTAILSCLSCHAHTLTHTHTFISRPVQHRATSCHTSHVPDQSQFVTTASLVTNLIALFFFQTPHFKVNIHTFVKQHIKSFIFITYSSWKFLFSTELYK